MAKSYTHLRWFFTSRVGSITSSSYLNLTVWAYRHCLIDLWLKFNPAKDHLTDKHNIVFEVRGFAYYRLPYDMYLLDLLCIIITVRGEALTTVTKSRRSSIEMVLKHPWPILRWSSLPALWMVATDRWILDTLATGRWILVVSMLP